MNRNRWSLWLFLLPLLLNACASGERSARVEKDSAVIGYPKVDSTAISAVKPVTTSEAVALINSLEQDPLSPEASARRMVLTGWVFASPDVGVLTPDDRYINDIFTSDYPYSAELFLQYMFGMAESQAAINPPEQVANVEAGIRSMLASYKSLVAADENLRDHFLDELDRIRQLGKLRSYIEAIDLQQKK